MPSKLALIVHHILWTLTLSSGGPSTRKRWAVVLRTTPTLRPRELPCPPGPWTKMFKNAAAAVPSTRSSSVLSYVSGDTPPSCPPSPFCCVVVMVLTSVGSEMNRASVEASMKQATAGLGDASRQRMLVADMPANATPARVCPRRRRRCSTRPRPQPRSPMQPMPALVAHLHGAMNVPPPRSSGLLYFGRLPPLDAERYPLPCPPSSATPGTQHPSNSRPPKPNTLAFLPNRAPPPLGLLMEDVFF